jgi:DNA-binding transcriptional LysR family regulator
MATDVLTGMRVFTTVVDAGSFAGAADKLDLSRGMTSRYVAQIEAHLGVRLLNRTTRRQSLTEAGTLRVNASVAFGTRHLGPAIGAWLQRHPQVKADLTLNDRFVDLVEEGFDVAVRIARRIDPGLVARPITRARLVACAAPAYLKQHGTPKSPADLARHNCLTYAYAGHQGEWRFTRHGRDQVVRVSGNVHGNNGDILCSAAAEGLGVIVQPTFLVYQLLREKKLAHILEDWEIDESTIYAVYPSRQFLTPKVRSFIDFLVERFGRNPYWDKGLD